MTKLAQLTTMKTMHKITRSGLLFAAAALAPAGILNGAVYYPSDLTYEYYQMSYDDVYVGDSTYTTWGITTGADVTAQTIYLGTNHGATVNVNGGGILNADSIIVGFQEFSTLTIDNGTVTATADLIVGSPGVAGQVDVKANSTLNAGTLTINDNSILSLRGESYAGGLSVGSSGTIKIYPDACIYLTSSLEMDSGATLHFDLGDGMDNNVVRIQGAYPASSLTADPGSVQLKVSTDTLFGAGTIFEIFKDVSISVDVFDSIQVVAEGSGQVFNVTQYSPGFEVLTRLIATAEVVPEPSTYALIGGAGVLGLAVLCRRRSRKA